MAIDIKETLTEAGLSQTEFAKLLGRKPEQVNRWYNGRRMLSPMMEDVVRRTCKEYEIEIIEK